MELAATVPAPGGGGDDENEDEDVSDEIGDAWEDDDDDDEEEEEEDDGSPESCMDRCCWSRGLYRGSLWIGNPMCCRWQRI